ncbi:HlyD family efflux transporter periplasmic adaptor subunit [Massilia agilis]|uniref:HlyD family efflux transporter periplasmic adaptor subunit n=1 Tax=Massilia agilis TaxID=1811226 RepID=A0ABT2DCN3_9BURK|nr:HlyD family efflux transporter periplasmic adaptor subunit [Massilia agilis]MCS0809079.1 HlyD family efflux transporter periplasmic adaptor subunit [Massilia agilis]
MDRHTPEVAVTGSNMDQVVPKKRGKLAKRVGAALAVLIGAGYAFWQLAPHGLQVNASDVRIATVQRGVFRDDIVVRATAEPLNSVILDSVESGRVEEVFARDGQMVRKGDLLFRLSNPQRNLELLRTQAETAQQVSNLSNLRVAQEAGRTDHQRRLLDLRFALSQVQKQHDRNVRLAAKGFISQAALEESADKLAQARHALEAEEGRVDVEEKVRHAALSEMQTAIDGLNSGLKLVSATVDALAVRAPIDGMLADFHLLVGQTVKTDEHIGRIDDPNRFKLTAQVDEFYLNRIAVGRHGSVRQDGKDHEVTIRTVYPQVKEGRFKVELVFAGAQPQLSPGQGLDAQLTLGAPANALLLPNGAFANDTGGTWAFVLDAGGASAVKRALRLGRRSSSQIEVLSGLAPGERVIVSSYTPFGKAERLELNK